MSLAAEVQNVPSDVVGQAIAEMGSKAKAPRATKSQQTKVVKETIKKSWRVSPEAIIRAGVHATMEHKSESQIVSEALESLNRWVTPAANNRGNRVPTTSAVA